MSRVCPYCSQLFVPSVFVLPSASAASRLVSGGAVRTTMARNCGPIPSIVKSAVTASRSGEPTIPTIPASIVKLIQTMSATIANASKGGTNAAVWLIL